MIGLDHEQVTAFPMNRRRALLTLLATGAVSAAAGSGAMTFRVHADPRRTPYLTAAHLTELATQELPRPRVLFIGNSMILRHDVPALIASEARADGIELGTAMAAADGARLIETLRIQELDPLLTFRMWDAVVLQDFTKTPLRAFDRWGSRHAMERIGNRVAPSPVVLYPPWPATADNHVYRDAGFLTTTPETPEDFMARQMAFYMSVAEDNGFHLANVPRAWMQAAAEGAPLFHKDGHHASPEGAALVARVLWPVIRQSLG